MLLTLVIYTGQGISGIQQLESLVTLNVGDNEIGTLRKDVFRPLRNLKAVVMNNNKIKSLDFLRPVKV